MSVPASSRRLHPSGPRADRMMAGLLTLEQTWADRSSHERWVVHQVHRADRAVTIRQPARGLRRTLTFRELLAGYHLVLLTGTGRTAR